MAQCAYLDQFGSVIVDGVTCQLYMLTPSEYAQFQTVISANTTAISLQDIFQIPQASDLGNAFQIGFNLVLIVWLSSWAFGSVVNYFSPEHDK